MLFGIIPDKWRHSIREQQQSALSRQQTHANYTSTLAGGSPWTSSSPPAASLVLDLVHGALLLVFLTLVVFAFILAQYLRRHELDEQPAEQPARGCDWRGCTCDKQLAGATSASTAGSLASLNERAGGLPAPKYAGLSQTTTRAPGRQQRARSLRANASSRSLISLANEEAERPAAASASSRHQTKVLANLAPLVQHGFYYAGAASKEAAGLLAQAQFHESAAAGEPAEPVGCRPQLSGARRRSGRRRRPFSIDNTRCRCNSSVASTLAAKLLPRLPPDCHADKLSSALCHTRAAPGSYCQHGLHSQCRHRADGDGGASNYAIKQKPSSQSGASGEQLQVPLQGRAWPRQRDN